MLSETKKVSSSQSIFTSPAMRSFAVVFPVLLLTKYRTASSPLSGEENPDLAYDIEGLTIYTNDESKYLLTSSQGNNRYAIYDINRAYLYLGAFEVGQGASIDGAEETDGIDVYSGAFSSAYPEGVFVCQDGYNKDEKGQSVSQNFKVIDWRTIKKAMLLP